MNRQPRANLLRRNGQPIDLDAIRREHDVFAASDDSHFVREGEHLSEPADAPGSGRVEIEGRAATVARPFFVPSACGTGRLRLLEAGAAG